MNLLIIFQVSMLNMVKIWILFATMAVALTFIEEGNKYKLDLVYSSLSWQLGYSDIMLL